MRYFSKQTRTGNELQERFNVKFDHAESYHPGLYNGFQFPRTPVITNKEWGMIQLYSRGLI